MSTSPTFQEIVDAYLELAGPDLAKRSLALTRRYLLAFCVDFGTRQVANLKRSDLMAWIRKQDRWPAPATKRGCINRIKACLSWAVLDDRIEKNPFAGCSWEDSPPRRSMTDDEFRLAMRAAPRIFRGVLWFLRELGCRPGELGAIKWSHVEWERRLAALPLHKTVRKTGAPRILYLSPLAVKFLRVLHSRRRPDVDRVFSNARGTAWTSCQMAYYWAGIRDATGLPKDCLLYGLRHRYATISATRNDLATTAALLGHRTVKTTARYYIHLDEQRQHMLDAAARVNEPPKPAA